jgi:hypothetical protein
MLSEDELNGVPLLVFCNKQDVAGALKPEAVSEALGLAGSERNREWSVRGSCATKGEGLEEGLDWLVPRLDCMRTLYLKLVVQAYQRHTEEIARISVRVVFLWSHCIISTFHNHCIASIGWIVQSWMLLQAHTLEMETERKNTTPQLSSAFAHDQSHWASWGSAWQRRYASTSGRHIRTVPSSAQVASPPSAQSGAPTSPT